MDRVGAFLQEQTPRRFLALAAFIGILVLFRHLIILLVFFVCFERLLAVPAELIARRSRVPRKASIGVVALLLLGAVIAAAAVGIGRLVRIILTLRETLPDRISALRETEWFQQLQGHLKDADKLIDGARHYAAGALGYVSALGHGLVYATIGFILAVVYLLEREEIEGFAHAVDPHSLGGTLIRWLGHVAEAMVVTVQFQFVVAACNAVLTLPILLLVGVNHTGPLVLMIFVSGLVPVVGNFVAGGILTFLAYQARGWLGVGVFAGLTFVLHKLESYYLNPRLASRHVRLPGFVLILSLLAWEHVLGFRGLFLSFPFLFVANRIRNEWRAEAAAATAK